MKKLLLIIMCMFTMTVNAQEINWFGEKPQKENNGNHNGYENGNGHHNSNGNGHDNQGCQAPI